MGMEVWIALRPASDRSRAERLGVQSIELDYADETAMTAVLSAHATRGEGKPWHYIIHNAGLTKTARVEDFYEANAGHTERLCSAIRRSGIQLDRFVLMSSLSVYGAPQSPDGVIRSTDTPRPTTHYGRSKLHAEQAVATSGLPYSIIQPTGVYGPGDEDYLMAVQSIARGLNFMAGSTPQTLTFVYGADVARAALCVARHPDALGGRYIVTDGDEYSDIEFGRMTAELLERRRVLNLRLPLGILRQICRLGSWWARYSGRITPLNSDKYEIMAQRSWRCDGTPLMALGWQPTRNLCAGLILTIETARAEGKLPPQKPLDL